jgi:cytochrome P450
VATVFTARAVAGWRHRTEEIVADLLDEAAERGRFDVVTDYAHVLPARIVSELIGLPDDDLPDLIRLSSAVTRSFESLLTPEQEAEALSATRELAGLLGEVLDAAARRPSTGLLDDLLAAEDGGDHLSRDDVIAQVTMLIAAGHETVGNLVGTGLLHLLEHPDQLALLRDDPSLDGPAVDELLRFDAPVQLTRRFAVSPIELHGTTIPVGGDVILGLGAANRDPAKWGPTADAVDLCRPGADEHLSFGGGAHYCMGAALGRLECAIALPGLVRRFPDLVPGTDRPAWVQRMVLRGLERFPVTV